MAAGTGSSHGPELDKRRKVVDVEGALLYNIKWHEITYNDIKILN